MLWDPGSVKKDEEEGQDNVPITPILVPLQNKPPAVEKSVPVLVPDVQDLKDQFQQQQNMLTQIKETLMQNESQLSSKGKQMEAYANKLSQIRARSKNTQGKKPGPGVSPVSPKLQKKLSKENLTKTECPETEKPSRSNSKSRKGKISELRKCLEENKIKFEQRTGKEQSETKKIESLVEQLKLQLEERDKTIQGLQKTIEEPTPKPESLPKPKQKQKESVASKTTQTSRNQPADDSIEIIALQNKIHELEANVLDLEENLKEKESVIEARTQAVTLLSQDLSLKGKNTLESLEETRQEMRAMQNNFIAIEDQLKNDLSDRSNRLAILEEKYKKLESTNFELSLKNAEQQEKLVNLQTKYLELDAENKSLKQSTVQGLSDDKLEELTKKIASLRKELDERNKAMIRMKVEHMKKMKTVEETLEVLKGESEEKAEIVRLNGLLEELEVVKTELENRVAELEDEKASEKKLKDQINELEIIIQKQNEDLTLHLKTISSLEKENFDLIQSNQDQNILIENLHARISDMEAKDKVGIDSDAKLRELSQRMESMAEEYNRKVELLKGEHRKEIEMLESYYNARGESLDRKALEEYRISTEISNIHVEEQIELLIREKQQLLEKLKSLSGVSSTDSLTFEKMDHTDLRDDRETVLPLGEEVDMHTEESKAFHLEKIVSDQQHLINDLQKTIAQEKQKVEKYQERISELEGTIKGLEDANVSFKQQIEMSEATESGKNTKTNTNTKNRIKKIEMELTQSKKTVQEQNDKLEELRLKLQEKEDLIKKYSERIEMFEKDDWDRQNHWKNTEDEIESVQELQKKCLSLENSLFELNEDCERLRKENIEVVHLLSEEKVKRRRLLEQMEAKPELRDVETQKGKAEIGAIELEERLEAMSEALEELEVKLEKLEVSHMGDGSETGRERGEHWEVSDLQEKLQWTNVVLTSKETEMFRLQNLLEDRNKAIEILEADSKELKRKLTEREKQVGELTKELKRKEAQLEEISANFDRLQDSVNATNEKTATNETQLKELLSTVKEMEGDVFRKETELQEIKGILAEKNLDMTNLRNRLEEVNSDLTYSYQEHLENMGKCLRDKESDYEALLAEKTYLEDVNRKLVAEKEELHNRKVEISGEKERLEMALLEREKVITELNEKIKSTEGQNEGGKDKNQEKEDLKIKLKKLAANLKKKAQNEAELTEKVKQLEGLLSEKEKRVEGLESEVKEVAEKWMMEKTEKEKVTGELSAALADKAAVETAEIGMREKVTELEKQYEECRVGYENHAAELGRQIQHLQEACQRMAMIEQQDKDKISQLEAKTAELSQLCANATSQGKQNQEGIEKERQAFLQELAETIGKYEELKFNHEQLLLEKSQIEKRLEEMQNAYEQSFAEKSSLEAKIQENLAVIETLETELKKSLDQVKTVEEKFFYSEDRRLSLESKNEEMCKKLMESSENLTTIDDLSVRIDELLKSEKHLQNSVRDLQSGNSELKQTLDQMMTEKYDLEKELKASTDKLTETGAELKELRSSDEEKGSLIRELNKTVEQLKAEKKQLSSEFDRLNRDYEQFETDFKENLENSQNVEKSLRHKIEELVNENASLTEKCNLLSEERHRGDAKPEEDGEEKVRKKRKSVTFRTDEVEYIKDLKSQLHTYDANLKRANEEIETLKAELFRERLRDEVSNVVAEAKEKVESLRSTPEAREEVVEVPMERVEKGRLGDSPEERKFDGSAFFGSGDEDAFLGVKNVEPQQSSELESLMWDDGWGSEGNLEAEYLSGKALESEKSGEEAKLKALEMELKTLEGENEQLKKDLQEQTAKYTKALKKLKEMKIGYDKLQSEAKKLKSGGGFGDLDAAIVDELKSQIENMETKEKELIKNLENAKLEKEALLKRIDVLNAGNEKFLEMKERQDNEVEIWQRKNNELQKEIAELRQQKNDLPVPDDNALLAENQELRNKVEALEWKNCELVELLEEKQEILEGRALTSESNMDKVMEEKSQLQKEVEELNNVRELLEKKLFDEEKKSTMTIGELNEQLAALASENETLQDILGEMKKTADAAKKEKAREEEAKKKEKVEEETARKSESTDGSKIFDYFKSSPGADLFPVSTPNSEHSTPQKPEQSEEINSLRQRISELEILLQQKEIEIQKEREQVEFFRQKLSEAEYAIKMRDDQFGHLQLEKDSTTQRFLEMEREKETIIDGLRKSIMELETLVGLRTTENQTMRQSFEKETAALRFRVEELEGATKLRDQFETVDLGQGGNMLAEKEVEDLRERVLELENVLRQREEELEILNESKTGEVESLRARLFEMEDAGRSREEEFGRWDANREAEMMTLRQKAVEAEELVKRMEQELWVAQSGKEEALQSLQQRMFEVEARQNGGQDKILELENLLNAKEKETEEKAVEVRRLEEKVGELEQLLLLKQEEIAQVMTRANILEKSYTDSKAEIERLLNEEKLNVEEKFVEPFQENMKIPVAFEVEAMSRTLNEEKQKYENLMYELSEKENLLAVANTQVANLSSRLAEVENMLRESKEAEKGQKEAEEESGRVKSQLEKIISDLEKELESSNLQLSVAQRELQEFENMKVEVINGLQSRILSLETELEGLRERESTEIIALRKELAETSNYYEAMLQEGREDLEKTKEIVRQLEMSKRDLEAEVDVLREELEKKEREIGSLSGALQEERSKMSEIREALEFREAEVTDLKETLTHLQEEIQHFRNFEKQVKELRAAQITEAGSEVPVTAEGHPDLSDWTEHELAELSTRLQSDLDTALYMLHQRDVRCDELTFELMQLLEERDTLQLRLSTALRINEELRAVSKPEATSSGSSLQENKDLVDQSNDRQPERGRVPGEDLQKLASKISELHSVSYLRDKTVKDESVQRHKEQMNLLSRVSDSDITLSRDFQSSPTVLLNWMRGKTTPKVMHI